jgi:nucleoside-diphosphate-sugar epimerase
VLERRTILVTGAAGNLGSLLSRHLVPTGHGLRLMFHRTPLAPDVASAPNVEPIKADLGDRSTLPAAVEGADVVVHFAGRLFAPRPETFLPETNTRWFANLLEAAVEARVGRVILISFPHVEGATSVEQPATGRLDRCPISVHAQTRLEEERLLFARTDASDTTPVVLRLGMVYGRGVLMVDAARWLARRRLLCVWKEPTLFHLLSVPDYLRALEAAILNVGVRGVYHVGDDHPVTLQQFLDEACRVWGCRKPRRVPFPLIYAAAAVSAHSRLRHARTGQPLGRHHASEKRIDSRPGLSHARERGFNSLN